MGGVISSIFGGGQQSSPTVVVPEAEVMPTEQAQEPEAQAVRDEEQRKIRARRGMAGTVLTSPLGMTGGVGSLGNSLLGRSGSV